MSYFIISLYGFLSFISFLKSRKITFVVSFFILVLIAITSYNVINVFNVVDVPNYKILYNNLSNEMFDFSLTRMEPLFLILNQSARIMGLNFESFVFIISIISTLAVLSFCRKLDNYNYLFLYLIICTTTVFFNLTFNQLRQGMAVSVFLSTCLFEKNKKKIVLYSIILSFIHVSILYACVTLILSRKIKLNAYSFAIGISVSLMFTLLPLTFVLQAISLEGTFLARTVVNAIESSDYSGGRIYYLACLILVASSLLLKHIKKAKLNHNYYLVEKFIFFTVIAFPLFAQVGLVVRLVYPAFLLIPIAIYINLRYILDDNASKATAITLLSLVLFSYINGYLL